MATKNQYIIIRDDRAVDPVTAISEGLLIGRLLECEVLLNHPSVSRVQAGIKQIEDTYYLFPLRPSNPVTLNGKPVEENEALASGDIVEVGPFVLDIDTNEDGLIIRVSLQIGMVAADVDVSSPGVSTHKLVLPSELGKREAKPRPAPIAGTKALDIFWDKRIREAGKMVRPSPLFPLSQRRAGKAQFNWAPTSDLGSRWAVGFFIWAAFVVAIVSVAAAYWYTSAYTPAPLSKAHTLTEFRISPAIAAKPNAGSCTSCHALTGKMEERCALCHLSNAFAPTVFRPHEAAGIGCITCHAEHKGADFSATAGGVDSCAACHNDQNQNVYNGRRVGRAHGGTFGYPVVNGVWSLRAINDEEWMLRRIPITRLPSDTEEKWKSKQFHALHSERVRIVPGLSGNALGQMSCSSCHKAFNPIDRETPRTTCGICHNGGVTATGSQINPNAPNCTSCHVQHVKDSRRWGTKLLAQVSP